MKNLVESHRGVIFLERIIHILCRLQDSTSPAVKNLSDRLLPLLEEFLSTGNFGEQCIIDSANVLLRHGIRYMGSHIPVFTSSLSATIFQQIDYRLYFLQIDPRTIERNDLSYASSGKHPSWHDARCSLVPPGWDIKFDASGQAYYINRITQTRARKFPLVNKISDNETTTTIDNQLAPQVPADNLEPRNTLHTATGVSNPGS
jgi:hypothetical protein